MEKSPSSNSCGENRGYRKCDPFHFHSSYTLCTNGCFSDTFREVSNGSFSVCWK